MKYVTTIGEREYIIEIVDERRIILDGTPFEVDFDTVSGQPVYSLLLDGQSYESFVYSGEEGWQVLLHGTLYMALSSTNRRRAREALARRRRRQHRRTRRIPHAGAYARLGDRHIGQ